MSTPTRLYNLSNDGREAIRQTLRMMAQIVYDGKRDIRIREHALSLIRGLKQKDFTGEIKKIFEFVQNKIRYVRDIHNIETVHIPIKVLEYGQGDCDDKSILLASLLESTGHPTRFVAAGFNGRPFSHVWVDTKIGTKWISLDATMNRDMGWKPDNITSTMIIYN
jgi:hypothetical protein